MSVKLFGTVLVKVCSVGDDVAYLEVLSALVGEFLYKNEVALVKGALHRVRRDCQKRGAAERRDTVLA